MIRNRTISSHEPAVKESQMKNLKNQYASIKNYRSMLGPPNEPWQFTMIPKEPQPLMIPEQPRENTITRLNRILDE